MNFNGLQVRRAHDTTFGIDPLFQKLTFQEMGDRLVRYYGKEGAIQAIQKESGDPTVETELEKKYPLMKR